MMNYNPDVTPTLTVADLINPKYLPVTTPGTGYNAETNLLNSIFFIPSRNSVLNALLTQQTNVWYYYANRLVWKAISSMAFTIFFVSSLAREISFIDPARFFILFHFRQMQIEEYNLWWFTSERAISTAKSPFYRQPPTSV
jgi:hypothetical protein